MAKKLAIFILILVIFSALPLVIKAATLYLTPKEQTLYQGDTFITKIRINSDEEEINAIEGNLEFPKDKLEVVDISKGGSVLNLWPEEPSYSNQTGEINFIGGVGGGFQGQAKILSIIFRVNSEISPPQSAFVVFKENSQVLLNDGKGTPASLNFQGATYKITERPKGLSVVSSESHPDQNRWYKNTTLYLYWDLKKEAEYSWVLSYDPLAEPDEIPDKPEPKEDLIWMGGMEYIGLESGIYYFQLKQKLPDKDWSKKITFRGMIDDIPPEEFEPKIGQNPAVFEGKYFLSFATQDKTSGVDHYEVIEEPRKNVLENFIINLLKKESEVPEKWKVAKSPYLLEDQSLQSKILVKAVEKAGNERIAEIMPPHKIMWEDVLSWIILTLIVMGIIWWLWKKYVKRHKYISI